MIARLSAWWRMRTLRERVLLGVMLALAGCLLAWQGILVPLDNARGAARRDLALAAQRNASVRAKVALLQRAPAPALAAGSGDLGAIVGQTAALTGLVLQGSELTDPNRVNVVTGPASSAAVLGWVAALEAQGLVIEAISIQSDPTRRALTATATVAQASS